MFSNHRRRPGSEGIRRAAIAAGTLPALSFNVPAREAGAPDASFGSRAGSGRGMGPL